MLEWPSPEEPPSEDVEGDGEWLANGKLGRLRVGARSKPNEELRLDAASKFPDRLPRSVAVRVKPESFRDMVDPGPEGCTDDCGECGDGGEPPRMVPLVPGLSYFPNSALACEKALIIGGLGAKSEEPEFPNAVELRFTSFAKVLGGGLALKTDGYSDMKES